MYAYHLLQITTECWETVLHESHGFAYIVTGFDPDYLFKGACIGSPWKHGV